MLFTDKTRVWSEVSKTLWCPRLSASVFSRSKGFNKKKKNENSIKPVIKWQAPRAVSIWRGEVKLKMGGWGLWRGSDVRSNQRVWTATGHLHFNHRKVRPACSVMFSRLWLNAHSVAKVIYGARRMHWPLSHFTHLHVPWQHVCHTAVIYRYVMSTEQY